MSAALFRPATRSRAQRAVGAVTAGLLAVVLTGCGAGFQAQTYQERPVTDGSNASVGAVAIRNIAVLPDARGVVPAGSDAPVRMTLVNNANQDDALVAASSPAATSIDITSGAGGSTVSQLPLGPFGTTGSTAGLMLRGVRQDLRSGETIPITLRFQRSGEVTMDVPVALTGNYDQGRPRSTYFHEPGQSGSGE